MRKGTLEDFLYPKIKMTPRCKTCEHRKRNMTTLCEKYRRIPSSVQDGGHCNKYKAIEEVDR